ncbi:MAG: 50S ribosome-binding GTPase [Actinomycetaceae bacterium]|nr:50S ribosome-binding GTPase [Actinomycetaceae bacterium]
MSDDTTVKASEKADDAAELSSRIQAIDTAIENIRAAIETGRDSFEMYQIDRAEADMEKVQIRLGAGKGLTVAALAGGTGSGKSSLFNALTGLEFADAGDIRPMTEEAAACVWNADASELLDLLGVSPARRITHDSPLIDTDSAFDGLVLLDLPDHDSIEIGHSVLVDSILPMVDVLIWVLDPQKYADHLIHDAYLAQMRRRKDYMVVVLNQIDTVMPERREALLDDVRTKLDADGLGDVPLYAVSAVEKEGLASVENELKKAIATTAANVATAEAELDAIRARLGAGVGESEAVVDEELLASTSNQIARAAGIPAVVESLHHAGTSIRPTAIARPEKPATSLTVATRDTWLSEVKADLPERWRATMEKSVPDADSLRRAIGKALDSVKVPTVATVAPRIIEVVGIILAILGVVQLLIGWPVPSLTARIVIAVVTVALAIGLRPFTYRMQLAAARHSAERFDEQSHQAIRSVVEEMLAKPSQEVLDRHRAVREELLGN